MISSQAVMRAIYDLGDRYQRTWPTAADIARYLQTDERDVLSLLLELRRQRLFFDRRRQNRRVWMPWGSS